MPTSASPNARLHRLAAYLRRQGRHTLAADLSAAVRDAEAMRRLRADHLSPAELTAAMRREPAGAADPAPAYTACRIGENGSVAHAWDCAHDDTCPAKSDPRVKAANAKAQRLPDTAGRPQ